MVKRVICDWNGVNDVDETISYYEVTVEHYTYNPFTEEKCCNELKSADYFMRGEGDELGFNIEFGIRTDALMREAMEENDE